MLMESIEYTKLNMFIKNNVIYKITIANYDKICEFSDEIIIIDQIIILGNELKIIKMEDNFIEIKGQIDKVETTKK